MLEAFGKGASDDMRTAKEVLYQQVGSTRGQYKRASGSSHASPAPRTASPSLIPIFVLLSLPHTPSHSLSHSLTALPPCSPPPPSPPSDRSSQLTWDGYKSQGQALVSHLTSAPPSPAPWINSANATLTSSMAGALSSMRSAADVGSGPSSPNRSESDLLKKGGVERGGDFD
jgi:hypothetical protein